MNKWLLGTLRGMDSPLQWAAGFSAGLLVGFLPADSLLPWAFILLLVLSGANLLTAFAGWGLGAVIAGLCPTLLESLGYRLLNTDWLQPLWAELVGLPLGIWCRFDDCLTAGSLVAGLAVALPVFVLTWVAGQPLRAALARQFLRSRWTAWLAGPDSIGSTVEAA